MLTWNVAMRQTAVRAGRAVSTPEMESTLGPWQG